MCKISDILSGNEVTLGVDKPALNSSDLTLFNYAPGTSCDVERNEFQTVVSQIYTLLGKKLEIAISMDWKKDSREGTTNNVFSVRDKPRQVRGVDGNHEEREN
jgi:hypothetical protein